MPSAQGYTLLDEEASSSKTDAARALEPLFDQILIRLGQASAAQRSAIRTTVSLTVGTRSAAECWLFDTREGVAANEAIKRVATDAADAAAVRILVPNAVDLLAVIERRMPLLRALAQRRLVISGALSELRELRSLLGAHETPSQPGDAVSVHVVHADASRGYGVYLIAVSEGGAS